MLIGVITETLTGANVGVANAGEIGESSRTLTVVRSRVNVLFRRACWSFEL